MSITSELLRLNIGGTQRRPGWRILNIVPGAHVDYVGTCSDLSRFATGSVEEVYASHVLEHLGLAELPKALEEIRRILRDGGRLLVGVPNLETLCLLMLRKDLSPQEKFGVMRMIYGGQSDPHDFHKIGMTREILFLFLAQAGFRVFKVVNEFGIFRDTSTMVFKDMRISLNVIAT